MWSFLQNFISIFAVLASNFLFFWLISHSFVQFHWLKVYIFVHFSCEKWLTNNICYSKVKINSVCQFFIDRDFPKHRFILQTCNFLQPFCFFEFFSIKLSESRNFHHDYYYRKSFCNIIQIFFPFRFFWSQHKCCLHPHLIWNWISNIQTLWVSSLFCLAFPRYCYRVLPFRVILRSTVFYFKLLP